MRTRSGKSYDDDDKPSPRNAKFIIHSKGQVRKVDMKHCSNCENMKVELDMVRNELMNEKLLKEVAQHDVLKLNEQILLIKTELEVEKAWRMSNESNIRSLMEKIPPHRERGGSENHKDGMDIPRKLGEAQVEAPTKRPENLLEKIMNLKHTIHAQVSVFEGYRQWVESAKFESVTKFEEFSAPQIEEILKDSFLIGSGGYGNVYRGSLMGRDVAVKVLDPDRQQGLREYESEVSLLKKVHHQNLIHLIGSCDEKGALVYEYMKNGSLDKRLRDFSWQKRVAVALDICSALIFLHSIRPKPVVHGDLKPENILFDSDDNMKISDFGICHQLRDISQSGTYHHITQGIPRGSPGFIDPEFKDSGKLTPVADVYAFGVILLQLVTGEASSGLVNLVTEKLKNCATLRKRDSPVQRRVLRSVGLVDNVLGSGWHPQAVFLLLQLGLACCDAVGKRRPDLAESVWPQLYIIKQESEYY